jgi:predicted dehydrogenase
MKAITRREFVTSSARTAAAVAASASALSMPRRLQAKSANDKIILGLIGAGGRALSHINGMLKVPNVEFKYVCDVHATKGAEHMRAAEQAQGHAPKRILDMRELLDDKDVDAVVIATPDHWHALAAIWACQAGKDVYVEKCPSIAIWEGRKAIEAARKYKRVVQVGFQNRSAPYAVTAREYLQSGKLGPIVLVKVYNLLGGKPFVAQPDTVPPEGLDWDRWLGPAKDVPYNSGRHVGWHDWWDYKGGALVDDGSHQLDLARMVLGNPPHPKSVCCVGGNYAYRSQREVPELQTITYDFGDFAMTCDSGNATNHLRKSNGEERFGKKWPHWPSNAERIEIYGTKQLMYLGRHGIGWQVMETDGKIVAEEKGYFPDKWHQPNFIECVRSRQKPNADIEQAHYSACLVHLGNLSYRAGNKQLLFDGKAERFTNSEEANRLLKPEYRKHYRVGDEV